MPVDLPTSGSPGTPPDPFQHLDPSNALKRAVEDGDLRSVLVALARGGDPNRGQVIGTHGRLPLLVHAVQERGHARSMAQASRSLVQQADGLSIVRLLLDAGADPTATSSNGDTVWHIAVAHQDNGAVRTLLAATTRGMNAARDDGTTPLHALAGHPISTDRCPPAAMRLLHAGADLRRTNPQGSVLHAAMAHCRVTKGKLRDTRNLMSWTRALIDAGLDLTLTNAKGETVMHWVAEHKRLDLAQVIWAATPGKDLMRTACEAKGRTAWDRLPPVHRARWRQAWATRERAVLEVAIGEAAGTAMDGGSDPVDVPVRRAARRL